MITKEEVIRVSPSGLGATVLRIADADVGDGIRITSLDYPPDIQMVFSVWWYADSAMTATVDALGKSETVAVPTSWERYVSTTETPSGKNVTIYPQSGGAMYLYMAQLEMGDMPSDWRPAPEDAEENIDNLETRMTRAELNITPEAIVATVRSSTQYKGDLSAVTEPVLSLSASDGTVFKTDTTTTTLTANLFYKKESITTRQQIWDEFGDDAFLRWEWKRANDTDYSVVTDSHVSTDGFSFTVGASDFEQYVTVRCSLVGDKVLAFDQITVTDLSDNYNVSLSTETYVFQGDEDSVLGTQTVTTTVTVQQGASQIPAVIGTITYPAGFTVVSDGVSPSPTLTITATSAVTSPGVITIPVIIGSVTVNKKFSYAIAYTMGKSIIDTEIDYAKGTSGTETPTSGWQSTIPSVPDGQYLWTRTTITYSAGDPSVSYSVARYGADGGGGRGIVSTEIKYAVGTSATVAPTPESAWGNALPAVSAGQYLWTRTTLNYSSGDPTVSYSVAGYGSNGKGISTTTVEYAEGEDGTTAPTSGWDSVVPSVADGNYLWTKTTVTYTDGSPSDVFYSVAKQGSSGSDGRGVASSTVMYADGGTNGTTAPESGWRNTVPTIAAGNYLWTRTVLTYTDGTTSAAFYSVARQGENGAAGRSITATEVKYNSGTSPTTVPDQSDETKWQTTPPVVAAGAYLWTRTRMTFSDGNIETFYSVAKQGENGQNGVGIDTVTIRYAAGDNNVTPPDLEDDWHELPPDVPLGWYLWTWTETAYTDGNYTDAYSVTKQGSDGTAITISSSNGFLFKNAAISTVLTANVYAGQTGSAEVSEDWTLTWYKDGVSVGTGNTYTVAEGSVGSRADFTVKLTDGNDNVLAEASASLSTIRDVKSVKWYYKLGIGVVGAWQENKRVKNTVGTTINFTPETAANCDVQVIGVKSGDKLRITGHGFSSYRLYAWANSSGVVTEASGSNAAATDFLLTAPADGYLVCNASRSYTRTLTEVYPDAPLSRIPDSTWSTTEPGYNEDSDSSRSLYMIALTEYTDGTWEYSDVSLSGSYEAAKKAYLLAKQNETRITNAETKINQTDEAIELLATKEEVSELNGRVEVAETVIKESADGVDIVVSSTNTFKGVTEDNETTVQISDSQFLVNTDVVDLNAGDGESLHIDEDGAMMNNLTVRNQIIAPNLSYRYTGPSVLYISPSYPGENDNPADHLGSLHAAFEMLAYCELRYHVYIQIDSDIYETAAEQNGLRGRGNLIIRSNEETNAFIIGMVSIYNCSNAIEFNHLNISAGGNVACVRLYNDSYVNIMNKCNFVGSSKTDVATRCILVQHGTRMHITNSTLTDAYILIEGRYATGISCGTVHGAAGTWDIPDVTNPVGGSIVAIYSPVMMYSYIRTSDGVRIIDMPKGDMEFLACLVEPSDYAGGGSSGSGGDTPTPPAQDTETTVTLSLTAINSYSRSWNNDNVMRQGIYETNHTYGAAWFSASIISGRTIKTASLTLTRVVGTGGSGSITVEAGVTSLDSSDSGNPMSNAVVAPAAIGSIAPGESATFSGSQIIAIAQALANNPSYGLLTASSDTSLRSGKKYSRNYGSFSDASLTVTY